ncbi:PREDICTED: GATA zinc finger domain-containing protein 16-like [Acromyrmex echinatior]|uniref:GATA zinc finger domain-containing protein 16-like n=1 Tax=Acromyrmex echinatior TaxID=103372 RepID=UPI000580DB81|nr:PREDICTED: GATA zinc finger domain-containing protein 16-like [Acromyrmex echinatior]
MDLDALTLKDSEQDELDEDTILNHLHKAGYKKNLDVWVPHELSVKNMMDRINICDTLLKRNKIELFLKRMITDDEKWITYNNRTRKRSWIKKRKKAQAIAKLELTTKKMCVEYTYNKCWESSSIGNGKIKINVNNKSNGNGNGNRNISSNGNGKNNGDSNVNGNSKVDGKETLTTIAAEIETEILTITITATTKETATLTKCNSNDNGNDNSNENDNGNNNCNSNSTSNGNGNSDSKVNGNVNGTLTAALKAMLTAL